MAEVEPDYMAEGSKNTAKLDPEHQEYVLQKLAEGYKPKQVQEQLRKEYGIELTIDGVDYYQRVKRERILEKRRALTNEMDRLASSSKFIRVRELEEQKSRLEEGVSPDMEDKSRERLILDNSEQRRKEMEGFKGILGLEIGNPFESLAGKADIKSINRRLRELETERKEKKG